ncbi:MAG: ATP synthase F1 subunit epsilon [Deltaproteobacteria bacterium]|nr:ATP synthase F1 subunit epsilon [Deltaproteobacteria bacterium]|tara:strand:- start:148 stop:582 length:435 start_codon:yes stop_codon:yes gene_type:complete
MSLQLRIVTPDGEVVSTQVDTVRITGVEGEFGILPGHLPFLSGLEVGPAAFEVGKITRYFALGQGYAEVFQDNVNVFVETADEATDIDEDSAKKMLAEAEETLKSLEDDIDSQEYKSAHLLQKRALTQLDIAKLAVEYDRPGEK